MVSAEPSSSFFKYEKPSGEYYNTLNRPTGAPVLDVELVGGALTNMTTRIDATDSWKARTWDPWLQLTTWQGLTDATSPYPSTLDPKFSTLNHKADFEPSFIELAWRAVSARPILALSTMA